MFCESGGNCCTVQPPLLIGSNPHIFNHRFPRLIPPEVRYSSHPQILSQAEDRNIFQDFEVSLILCFFVCYQFVSIYVPTLSPFNFETFEQKLIERLSNMSTVRLEVKQLCTRTL